MPGSDYSDCPLLVRDFLSYMLTIRGRSARTVEAYHGDLRLFLRYIKQVKILCDDTPLEEIDVSALSNETICSIGISDVYAYLSYTHSGRGNNAATRSRKVSALRSFYKYIATKTGLLKDNPMKDLEMPSIRRSVPRYLTLEESLELLIRLPEDSKSYERDYCILTFFLNCGMRLSELCGINMQDIRENALRLLGKGNKERMIYLNDACLAALEQYKKVRKPPGGADKNALFVSAQGRRITPRRVEQIVKASLFLSDLDGKGYSPHKLRHTAATLMYQHGGVDIRALKEILGHANLSTTEIYTHVSNKQIENAIARSPLAQVKAPKGRKTQKENDEDE